MSLEEEDADLHLGKNGRKVAVEVALSSRDREVDHVEKRLQQGFDQVVVAVTDATAQEELGLKIENQVSEDDVKVVELTDLSNGL